MAKNTANSTFRKIDVDQYNEDLYREEEGGEAAAGPDEAQLQQMLAAGRTGDALQYVLQLAPAGSRSQPAKDAALQAVMRVLTAFRTAEMEPAVRALSQEQADLLMKYVYRGFEVPSEGSSGHLLAWHEKLYGVGGVGCIVRVLTDRKRV
ncbi:actin-related protein 2/3 complex subunit 5-C-like [Pollicipes pollicipes]|uniref:actin-related protein 2/3 complex subunit 5-C-like n=1 Tax=Pollicipes pollicipes TaxID=41117 RepID=UPI001884D5A7|nr:actin-related protein 2/3 complex subunit 5-C-like [Pollicipes pollicipes]